MSEIPPPDDPVIIVPIPALVTVLAGKEAEKGSPLTREEVEGIRDNAACLTMHYSDALKLEQQRGYADINPARCWEEWSARRNGHR